ncbi:MarR family winged helix-turn-helix transcriptional regulator [Mycolicibacterium palauense]|uniref:MarR family winged helix-turn-helix transcriptional regulator n=1 Tax=Mycolicibacterium palauense TaxID=2034511 RepID=UPI001C3F2681|nr:MarR family transcriptional regulator [Mycolicibacterium palauense]
MNSLEEFMRAMFTSLIVGLSRSLKDQQLSVVELAALHLIDQHGTLRVGDIAKRLDVALVAASRAVSKLVDQGLVLRAEDPGDRRSRTLTLSDAGRDLIDATSAERVDMAIATAAELPGPVMERIAAVLNSLGADAQTRDEEEPQ